MKIDGFVKNDSGTTGVPPVVGTATIGQTERNEMVAKNMADMIERYLSMNIVTMAHLFKDGQAALVQHNRLNRMH